MSVFSPMSECEARRIVEPCGRAVHHFRDEGERLQRARPELLEQQDGRRAATLEPALALA